MSRRSKRDTGIWTQKSSLSDTVDSLLNRVDATQQSIGTTWTQDRAIVETLDALQERVDALGRDIGVRLQAVQKGTSVLIDEAAMDGQGPVVDETTLLRSVIGLMTPRSIVILDNR